MMPVIGCKGGGEMRVRGCCRNSSSMSTEKYNVGNDGEMEALLRVTSCVSSFKSPPGLHSHSQAAKVPGTCLAPVAHDLLNAFVSLRPLTRLLGRKTVSGCLLSHKNPRASGHVMCSKMFPIWNLGRSQNGDMPHSTISGWIAHLRWCVKMACARCRTYPLS